jgi:hypothetical protein
MEQVLGKLNHPEAGDMRCGYVLVSSTTPSTTLTHGELPSSGSEAVEVLGVCPANFISNAV